MSSYTHNLAELIRHERPSCGCSLSNDIDVCISAASAYMSVCFGVVLPEEEQTIEDIEKRYEEGWSAIINDGKLLGFRNEKTL